MTQVEELTVGSDDPRWAEAGITRCGFGAHEIGAGITIEVAP